MDYPEDISTAANFLKGAIPKMVERKLPANPINYAVWYNYAGKHNPALTKAIDQIINNGEDFTDENCKQLFLKHIVNVDIEKQQTTMGQLTELTNQLIVHMTNTAAGNSAYDDALQASISKLEETPDVEEINEILTRVLSSAQGISSANKEFQSQIYSASAEINQLKQELVQAQNRAYIDSLTQLYNRHAFDEKLKKILAVDDTAKNTCLIIVDLDHFKSFNDNYGHLIGDQVLTKIGEIITKNCPENCIGTRYGGEEFAIIVTNTKLSEAAAIAELLRQKIRQQRVKIKSSAKVLDNLSASFGVAQFELGESKMSFIDRADKALYDAKKRGRDAVVCWNEISHDEPVAN